MFARKITQIGVNSYNIKNKPQNSIIMVAAGLITHRELLIDTYKRIRYPSNTECEFMVFYLTKLFAFQSSVR